MKRVFSFIIVLAFLFFIYQFVVMLFISHHEVVYNIVKDDKNFEIVEIYEKEKDYENYVFKIKEDTNTFYFHNSSKLNKKDKIISNVEYFEKDELYCIYPVIENKSMNSEIVCLKNNKLLTYSALKSMSDYRVDEFVIILKNKNYENLSWINNDTLTPYHDKQIYKDNLIDNETIILFNYDSIDYYTKEKIDTINLFRNDRYENDLGVLVNNYYVIPNYDQRHEFNSIYIINLKDKSKKEFVFSEEISFDSYINGVVDNDIYLFDKDNKVQYKINPKDETIEIVGSIDVLCKYYNGDKFIEMSVGEFVNKKQIFKEKIDTKILEKYEGYNIYQKGNIYYLTKGNEVYILYKNYLSNPVLLFKDDINNITFKDENIYYIKDNLIKRYNPSFGLKNLIIYNELKYNHQNIYDVYVK